jgi:hypothetical protein
VLMLMLMLGEINIVDLIDVTSNALKERAKMILKCSPILRTTGIEKLQKRNIKTCVVNGVPQSIGCTSKLVITTNESCETEKRISTNYCSTSITMGCDKLELQREEYEWQAQK